MSETSHPGRGSRTIDEWCTDRRYSKTTFYKMEQLGIAPKVTRMPGAPPRITDEADAAWIEMINNPAPKMAAEIERAHAGRRERARKAATKAVASPLHVSRRHGRGV